jgi:large subunit ribosomal protein L29
MKAEDLRERSTDDLTQLCATLRRELFGYRMRNCTKQLDDTSLLSKTRRDIARIEGILHQRALARARTEAAEGGSQ